MSGDNEGEDNSEETGQDEENCNTDDYNDGSSIDPHLITDLDSSDTGICCNKNKATQKEQKSIPTEVCQHPQQQLNPATQDQEEAREWARGSVPTPKGWLATSNTNHTKMSTWCIKQLDMPAAIIAIDKCQVRSLKLRIWQQNWDWSKEAQAKQLFVTWRFCL